MSGVPSGGWREVYAACGVTAPDRVDIEVPEPQVRYVSVGDGWAMVV